MKWVLGFSLLIVSVFAQAGLALESGRYQTTEELCDIMVVHAGDTITTQGTSRLERDLSTGKVYTRDCNQEGETQVYKFYAKTGYYHLVANQAGQLYRGSYIIAGDKGLFMRHSLGEEVTQNNYQKID